MIGLADAQSRLLALKDPVERETTDLRTAAGRWTSDDVLARRTQPAHDLSAMDGYAIRFTDMPGPWRVIGESAAGRPFAGQARSGDAVRIFTGAALPQGTDAIVIQEDVSRAGEVLTLHGTGPSRSGDAVRSMGEDFRAADVLIPADKRLTPARIALAAMGGHASLPARRRIRIAIASTGSELVAPVNDDGEGLPDSNGPMLEALLADLPVDVTAMGIVIDSPKALAALLEQAQAFDILVTTGGASVGDHDLVRPALIAAGAEIDFWKVAIRPGKPVLAARLGETVILGLPGNPVSAFVTAHLFLRPMIRHLSGATDPLPVKTTALLGAPLPAVGSREDFVRARWSGGRVVPVRAGDSGALAPLADAGLLVVRPAHAPPCRPGDVVDVISIA